MSEVEEFTHTVEQLRELAATFEEFRQARQHALRAGVFAHSPDPIVFGPDTLRFTYPSTLDFKIDDRYYIADYRRSDYPDISQLW
jgi:hypothetical protein